MRKVGKIIILWFMVLHFVLLEYESVDDSGNSTVVG